MTVPRNSTTDARTLFLKRIEERLADSGKPLSGLALEYWRALDPEDEDAVDRLWADRQRKNELAAIEKEFESVLYDAFLEDMSRDPAATERYRRALDDIKSVEGVQLQAIVFAAAMRLKALSSATRTQKILSGIGIALLLLAGYWILRK